MVMFDVAQEVSGELVGVLWSARGPCLFVWCRALGPETTQQFHGADANCSGDAMRSASTPFGTDTSAEHRLHEPMRDRSLSVATVAQ